MLALSSLWLVEKKLDRDTPCLRTTRMKNISISILLVVLCAAISFAQDTPLNILEQPRPALPKDYGTLDAQGAVRLKVEFLANGEAETPPSPHACSSSSSAASCPTRAVAG